MKPTEKQKRLFTKIFGATRFVYNWGLSLKIDAWRKEHKSLSYNNLAKQLTSLKKEDSFLWLNDVPNVCLQYSLRNLENAYSMYFKTKNGFPKYKKKKKSHDAAKFILNVYFDFEKWKVKIPRIGWVKLCANRSFDTRKVKQFALTVKRDKCGDYWCSIIVEDGTAVKDKISVLDETTIGIDLGIKDYAILSNGIKYENPKFFEKKEKQLKKLQRRFSRSQKESNRREVLRVKISKLYRKVTNQKNDYIHKLTSQLVHNYDTICLEKLNVDGMEKNHSLAKSIQSVSWPEFVRQISYKSDWNGKNVVFIGMFDPSSKTCNFCGCVNRNLKLSDRFWVCPDCGAKLDRDINAARNIKSIGLNLIKNGPKVDGLKDGEGNDNSHPVKRQYCKSKMG